MPRTFFALQLEGETVSKTFKTQFAVVGQKRCGAQFDLPKIRRVARIFGVSLSGSSLVVERLLAMQEIAGSTPVSRSIKFDKCDIVVR